MRSVILAFLLLLSPLLVLAQKPKVKRINTEYEKGTLTDGKPTGVWEFFDSPGKLSFSMNYDSSRVVYLRPDTAQYRLRVGQAWKEARPSRPVRYVGSTATLHRHMAMRLRYPAEAVAQRQTGTVVIGFTVDARGQASEFAVEQSVGKACDEQALQVVQTAPHAWLPAVHLGRPTDTRLLVHVHFMLAKPGETGQQVADRTGPPARRGDFTLIATAYPNQ